MNRPQVKIYFEPRDLWFGVYWSYSARDPDDVYDYGEIRIYVCLVPMLPIRLILTWGGVKYGGGM